MTQQGLRQKTVRALTGRALTYVGDWHALFDQEGIPAGTYEGRQLRWLNQVMGTSYDDIREARQVFAEQNGAFNWQSMGEFESFSLSRFMAQQEAGIWYRFTDQATLFQTTDESTPVTATGQVIGRVNDQRVGAGSPANGTQSTNSFRATFQTGGAKFDALDDRFDTGYLVGTGANFMVARLSVPASLSNVQLVAGAHSAAPTSTFMLGVNASGQAVGGGGVDSFTTVVGTTDLRGTDAVIAISFEPGGRTRLFVNSGMEYDAAAAGTPNTSLGLAIGARNNAGTPQFFQGGTIREFVAGRQVLDLALFNQIANALRST